MCWYFLPPHLPSCKPIFLSGNFSYKFQTCTHLTPFGKNLVCQNLILPISGPFIISIQLAKFWSDLLLHDFSPMCRSLPVFSPFQSAYRKFPLNWNCPAQTCERHLRKHRLWQNYYSYRSRHVCGIWYSWPRHAPSQAQTYIWPLWFCHLLDSVISVFSLIFC